MKVLELFSGMECLSNAFRARGHEAYTIDWEESLPSSRHCDIGTLKAEEILRDFGKPDVIWAAFDCTTFSVAAISHHRRQDPVTGNLDPVSEYAKRCDEVDQHVLDLIRQLDPKVFVIENPRGGLRKMTWMKGLWRQTTTYCQYGFPYMKPTDFFSNVNLYLKPPCRNGDPCHEAAPRGSRHGLQGVRTAKDRSVYPTALCEHIVDVCEDYILGTDKIEKTTLFDD